MYHKILVALENSRADETLLPHIAELAKLHGAGISRRRAARDGVLLLARSGRFGFLRLHGHDGRRGGRCGNGAGEKGATR